jgi:hypothetical protein
MPGYFPLANILIKWVRKRVPEVSTLKNYEYHRIKELVHQLEIAGVEREIIDHIMQGGEDIKRSTKPEVKADWMREAMIRMNNSLDLETRKAVREGCACCLGGRRLKISKSIAKENDTLEDRIKAANEAKMVFGNGVEMLENGEIMVRFAPEGLDHYRCVCLPKATKPLPITYCFCCGGHVKHHLQTALDMDLDCTTRSSALSSGGKKPCTFTFSIKS